jgi:hypothetical protein
MESDPVRRTRAGWIQVAAKETGHDFAPATLNHFGDAFPIDDLHAAWMRHFNLMVETRA